MLKDIECKNFEPQEKPYKKADSGGLYLLVKPGGGKYWRLKYRYGGKEKLAALGVYPKLSLKEARKKRDEYKLEVEKGTDPTLNKKQKLREIKENIENTFENIALAWHKNKWKDKITKDSKLELSRLKRHIFPDLGKKPIRHITDLELIRTIKKIEDDGLLAEAKKTRCIIGQVYKYAMVRGLVMRNVMADTKGAYKQPPDNNYPNFSEKEFKQFLRDFDKFKGYACTKLALKFLILTFVRSGELRGARWEEFDFDKNEWRIPAERMKMKEQHIVPLSKQALRVLEEARKYFRNKGDTGLIFHSLASPDKEMSDNALSKAFRDQGYQGKATPHGMRATASTILNENGFKPDVIERQLAHCERNKVRAAYNHAQYLQERREMMDWWGNYVEKA